MFTGIVKGLGEVVRVHDTPGLKSFTMHLPEGYGEGLSASASVAINGACMTATAVDGDSVSFDAMAETLKRTNIGTLKVGDRVNVERSARMGDEIGGHVMSGHVVGQAEIIAVKASDNNRVVTFRVGTYGHTSVREVMKYILQKGFIGLDGCSLTVVDPDKIAGTFQVWLIPETLRVTTFGFKGVGDSVNLEVDSRTQIIVDTVEEVLARSL